MIFSTVDDSTQRNLSKNMLQLIENIPNSIDCKCAKGLKKVNCGIQPRKPANIEQGWEHDNLAMNQHGFVLTIPPFDSVEDPLPMLLNAMMDKLRISLWGLKAGGQDLATWFVRLHHTLCHARQFPVWAVCHNSQFLCHLTAVVNASVNMSKCGYKSIN